MKKFKFLTALIILLIFTSCSSNSADDDDMGPPTDPVTYSGTVKGIIDGKCLGCHTNPPKNNAPMALTTYDNVKDAVSNRGLIGRVEDGSMPPVGDDLTSAQIKSIKDWQAGGFIK